MGLFNSLSSFKSRRKCRVSVLLALETLEERWLLNAATIIVTTTADDPTSPIAGQTTLRDAISQANSNPGSTIVFNIPANESVNDIWTIQPTAPLPKIAGSGTVLDGWNDGLTNQPHAPAIVVDGSQSGGGNGLEADADNITIEGLDIINWSANGIQVDAVQNTVVNGNFIGIEADGETAAPNGNGVYVGFGATGTVIGDLSDQGYGNVISGNSANGINTAAPVTVVGNIIGPAADEDNVPVDSSGNPIDNNQNSGLLVQGSGAAGAIIGEPGKGLGNLISGNIDFGLQIGTSNVQIQNNLIGTTANGANPLPNKIDGILISDSDNITIGNSLQTADTQSGAGNIIGFNQTGVSIDASSQKVTILENSIKDNGTGIAGGSQAVPNLIGAAYTSPTTLFITGTLSGTANTTYRIEFFNNPSSNNVQGQVFLGATSVTTDANGTAAITAHLNVPAGLGTTAFTASATDASGNTSLFSNAVTATSPPPPTLTLPPSSPPPSPSPSPPALSVPPLLAFFNALLRGTETINADGTETITDRLFGLPLLVSTFDASGHLVSATLFGLNVTFLFA